MFERFSPRKVRRFEDELYNPETTSNFESETLPLDLPRRKLPGLENPFESMRPTFDPNAAQVGMGELPQPPPVTPQAKPNILDEYSRITGAHPDRDALRALMNTPPSREQFRPGKMDRLAAILGGAAAGWRNPAEGINVAQEALDRPFNQAQAEYEKKLRNVSALAGMEGEDIQQRIGGLKFGEDVRKSDRSFEREALESDRTFQENVRQFGVEQAYRASSLRQQGWKTYTDEKDGMLKAANIESGEVKVLGRAAQTSEEKLINEKSLERLKGDIESRHIKERGKEATDLANVKGEQAIKAIEKKTNAAIAQARAKAESTPDAKAKAAWNKVVELGMNGINVNDYINFKGEIPVVEYQGYFPDKDDLAMMERIKEEFSKGMNSSSTVKKDPLGIR